MPLPFLYLPVTWAGCPRTSGSWMCFLTLYLSSFCLSGFCDHSWVYFDSAFVKHGLRVWNSLDIMPKLSLWCCRRKETVSSVTVPMQITSIFVNVCIYRNYKAKLIPMWLSSLHYSFFFLFTWGNYKEYLYSKNMKEISSSNSMLPDEHLEYFQPGGLKNLNLWHYFTFPYWWPLEISLPSVITQHHSGLLCSTSSCICHFHCGSGVLEGNILKHKTVSSWSLALPSEGSVTCSLQ